MATIVLVVASTTGLSGGDTLIRDRLVAAGHTVVLRNDEDAEYTGTYDGVVIGDSSVNATVGTKYDTVAKPAMCTESMTSGWRLGSSTTGVTTTQWDVQNVPAAIGSVPTGTRTVYSTGISQQGINPAGTHTVVAYRAGTTDEVYVTWEAGAALSSGTAPAKRCFFRLSNSAGNSVANGGSVATDGVGLLDAAIAWTFAPAGVAPTVDAGADVPAWEVNTEFTRLATVDNGGLTTTTAWTITTAPAGGGQGTTIESDADLAWTPTVVGAYVLRATSTNSAGSDFDEINVTVTVASDTLRMYLTATDLAGAVTMPAQASFWDVATSEAINDAHQLSSVPEGAAEFRGVTESVSTNPLDALIGRWVSGPAQSAGAVLADEIALMMARGQSTDDTAAVWEWAVRVITSTGTLRGEVAGVFFSLEWPTVGSDTTLCVASGTTASVANVSEVAVSTGDRILVEIGCRLTNTLTAAQTAYVIFGGTDTTDLASGNTGANLSRPSWIDIPVSAGLTFSDEAESGGGDPGSVFDLVRWHLTLPTEDPGPDTDAAQIDQPALDTYSDDHFFLDNENRMVFVAPIEGATTSGASGATRSELRQRTYAYALAAMDPDAMGLVYQMTVTCYPDPSNITPDPPGRKEMIFCQIHGADDSPIPLILAAEYHVATPRVRTFKNGPGLDNPVLGITPTTAITVRMRLENARLKVWVIAGQVADLNPATPTYDWPVTDFTDQSGWYFKVGAYNKTEIGSGADSGEAINKVSFLELIDPDDVEPPTENPFPQMAHFFGGM
jgi:hypothetical protein